MENKTTTPQNQEMDTFEQKEKLCEEYGITYMRQMTPLIWIKRGKIVLEDHTVSDIPRIERMVESGIVEIETKKVVTLTKKGKELYHKIQEIEKE